MGTRDVWLTAPPLTALETATVLPAGSVFLDRALQRHVRFPTMYRAFCRNMGRLGGSQADVIDARGEKLQCAAAFSS
jgi:hypothetical protein